MAQMNMIQALNSAMDVMMARDASVVVMGEDVGYFGGVFRVTDGLQRKYGEHRVLDSPISEGCLCPKGAATMQLVTGDHRVQHVLYRRPGGTAWDTLPLETAMEMVADRVQATRERTWQEALDDGAPVRRTLGIAHIGGATLDNEENYLLKKLYTALGIIQVENQARI